MPFLFLHEYTDSILHFHVRAKSVVLNLYWSVAALGPIDTLIVAHGPLGTVTAWEKPQVTTDPVVLVVPQRGTRGPPRGPWAHG